MNLAPLCLINNVKQTIVMYEFRCIWVGSYLPPKMSSAWVAIPSRSKPANIMDSVHKCTDYMYMNAHTNSIRI